MKARIILLLSVLVIVLGSLGLFLAANHYPSIGNVYLSLVAILLGISGFILLCKNIALYSRSIRTVGELSGWHEAMGPGQSVPLMYSYRKISFYDSDGTKYEFTAGPGFQTKPQYEIGDKFPVRYDPNSPQKAKIDGVMQFLMPPVIVLLLSVCTAFALLKRLNVI